jgi:elongation factor P hydroxylase
MIENRFKPFQKCGILKGMEAVYQLKPDELTDEFFKAVKETFKDKEVKITIEDKPQDETEYLLQNKENRRHLLAGIKADKEGRYSSTLTIEEIEHWVCIGKTAEENPDLPYAFIQDVLKAKAEIDNGETSIFEFRHE